MLQSPPPPIPPEDFAILARSAASPQALADLVALYRRLQPDPARTYHVPDPLPLNAALCDRTSRLVMVSPGIGDLFGIPVDDFLGRTFDEIAMLDFDTPGGGRMRVQFADALNGKPTIAQLEQLWEPLPPVTLEYTLTPITAVDGQVTHVLFTLRDVTEAVSRQQAMKDASAARAVAARYRTLVQSLPVSSVLMFDHDLRYVIVEGGESLREQGLDPAQFPGATLYDLVPDDQREQAIDEYKRTLAGEEITRIVERGDRIFRSRYVPVHDDGGDVIAGLIVNEDITAERRSEEALRLSERRFRALAASIPASTVLVFDHDLRYVIVEGCDVFARHGYNADAMRGRTLREVIRPEAYAAVSKLYQATLAGEEIRTEFVRDGHVYETHFFPVYDDHGAVTYGTALTEDITHTRKAQEALRLSEQRFRALATSIPDSAVVIFDHDLRYVIVEGRDLLARIGFDADTMVGKTLYEVADEASRLAYNEMLYQAALEGRELKVELERNGYIVLARFFPVRDDDGQVIYGALLIEDITETKQKEAALRESQARFERAFAISPLGMALVGLDGRFVETNHSLQRMLGYNADELRQRTTADVTHPDDRHIRNASELLKPDAAEYFQIDKRYVHKDGRTVWGRLHVTLLRTDDGTPLYYLSQIEDITETHHKEAELHESRARFEQAFAISPIGTALVSLDLRLFEVNHRLAEMLGYTVEELTGKHVADFTLPDDMPVTSNSTQQLLDGQIDRFQQEKRYAHKDGSVVWGLLSVALVRDVDGAPLYFVSKIQDITERKRMEAELREAKQRFEQAFNSSPLGMAMTSLDLTFIATNRSLNRILGYEPGGLDGVAVAAVSHADDMRENVEQVQRLYRGEIDYARMEKRYIHKDGSVVWGSLHVSVVRDAQGRPLYQVSQIEDITERRRMEAELRDAQARFKLGFDASPIGMALVGRDMRYQAVNPALCRMFGYSAEELLTLGGYDLTHPDDREVTIAFRKAFEVDPSAHYQQEKRYIHKDGHIIWATLTPAAIRDDNGEVQYYLVQIEDITERKRIEAELRESQARFKHAFEESPLGMSLATEDYRILSINPALARMLGYSVEELLTMRVPDITHPDDLTLDVPYRRRLFAGEIERYHYEKRYIHKDGHTVCGSVSVGLVRDADGQPMYTVVQIEDITERKRAEAALRESQARFQSAFANSPVGMVLVTPDGRFFESNASFQRMLGYSAAEIHELDVDRITVPDDLEADHAFMQRLLAGDTDHYRLEKRYFRKDGAIIWIVLTAAIIRDEQGEPLYFVSQVEDITERKRAEAALRESQARFQRAFENSPIGMALVAPDLHVMSVNRAFEQMVGYSSGELTGMHAHDITYPDDIPPDDTEKQRLFAGDIDYYQIEKRYIHKDGHIIWTTLTESVIRDEQGVPLYLVAQIEDITERKQMITELRSARQRYENLVSSLPGMVFQLRQMPDGSQHFDYFNPRVYDLVGLTAEEIMADARVLIALVDEADQESLFATQNESRERLTPFIWEGLYHLPSGETAYYHIESQPVRQPDGSTVWTGIGVDVTAQRYLQTALLEQEKLRVSLAKEREVSDLKSNMMVHISHEFRTPLAIIQSSSELLDRYSERMTADKRREHTTRVYEEVHHLASILDELSILAHGDGWGKANLMRVNLTEVCARVIERVQRGTHISHRIEVQQSARLPELVNIDPRLVETMLSKLVQNAAKFSEPGSRITIEMDATARDVLINVRDEGIGIPEDEMRRLFEPFFKGSNNDLPTGMGLGLSIVRDAVLLHGGTIHAQSAVGQGTVFMIRLPQQMA